MMNLFNKQTDFVVKHDSSQKPRENDLIFITQENNIFLTEDNQITSLSELYNLDIDLEKLYLFGAIADLNCFCYSANASLNVNHLIKLPLRTAFSSLTNSQFQAALLANHLSHWLHGHQFCGVCANRLTIRSHEFSLACSNCDHTVYPTISPCIIVLINNGDKILLAKNKNSKNDMYSCIAGFVNPGENLETALKREVMEEVGLQVSNIRYITSQHWPFPHSLMMGFWADYASGDITIDYNELADVKWVNINELDLINLPTEISIAYHMIMAYKKRFKF